MPTPAPFDSGVRTPGVQRMSAANDRNASLQMKVLIQKYF
ncbi:unnamed protein product [marine sediment metagenome]|uniref:Uncharacterized protein n=1 Tax=marine sediment metagenome TaxID=412755 RepID=X0TM04_9ZZZZ